MNFYFASSTHYIEWYANDEGEICRDFISNQINIVSIFIRKHAFRGWSDMQKNCETIYSKENFFE